MDVLNRIINFLGSIGLAVMLLLVLMCAMIVGTLWESVYGSQAALVEVYGAGWFIGLLALLAVNLIAAVAIRWPLNRNQVGFAITHVAIIVILAGAWRSYSGSLHGWLSLSTGRGSNQMMSQENVLAVSTAELSQQLELPSNPRKPADAVVGHQFTLADGTTVRVSGYLPNASWSRRYEPVDGGDLAVQVAIEHMGGETQRWLSTESQGQESIRLGGLPVTLERIDQPDRLAEMLAPQPETQAAGEGPGHLIVSVGEATQTIEIAGNQGQTIPLSLDGLDAGAYSLKLVQYLPHAVVGADRTFESRSDRPENPLAVCEVIGPEGPDRRLTFAKFPEFSKMHSMQLKYPQIDVMFTTSEVSDETTGLRLIVDGDAKLHYVLKLQGTAKQTGIVETGARISIGTPGVDLRVEQYIPSARLVEEPVELPYHPKENSDDASPVIQLMVATPDGGSDTFWLPFGQQHPLAHGDHRHGHISFRRKGMVLPFEVKLEKFEIDTYPGTDRPKMFRSRVVLSDSRNGTVIHKAIEMNAPLRYDGFMLSQSSYQQSGGQTISVLGVSRDSGWPVALVGYIMVMLGMTITLITRMRSYFDSCKRADEISPQGR